MLFNPPQVGSKIPGLARIKLPADKRQRILLFVSIAAILGIIAVFYFSSGSSAPSNPSATVVPTGDVTSGATMFGMSDAADLSTETNESTKAKLKLNELDSLSSRVDFKSLKSYTDTAKPFGLNTERGRSNPFLPY